MKTTLTPIDFSPATERVVDQAAAMARAFGGSIMLLHVVRVPPVVAGYDMEMMRVAEATAAMEQAADARLAEVKADLQARGIVTESLRLTGSPVPEILRQAARLPAEFIVIGSHGHTAFYDLIVGSTTSGVIKRATCPVIIVPRAQAGTTPARREEPAARLQPTT